MSVWIVFVWFIVILFTIMIFVFSPKRSKSIKILMKKHKVKKHKIKKEKRKNLQSQNELVDYLVMEANSQGIIIHDEVIEAMKMVDRKDFTNAPDPYRNSPQPMDCNVVISAPNLHFRALNELFPKLQPGNKALDIGSGSGYLVAVMALLVVDRDDESRSGKVIGIEHMQTLVDSSIINIGKHHQWLLNDGIVTIIKADGRNLNDNKIKYDAIHVGAVTDANTANVFIDQLVDDGILVIPIQGPKGTQQLVKYTKQNNSVTKKNLLGVRYVPLTSENEQKNRKT